MELEKELISGISNFNMYNLRLGVENLLVEGPDGRFKLKTVTINGKVYPLGQLSGFKPLVFQSCKLSKNGHPIAFSMDKGLNANSSKASDHTVRQNLSISAKPHPAGLSRVNDLVLKSA
jgi:hypothetical protein